MKLLIVLVVLSLLVHTQGGNVSFVSIGDWGGVALADYHKTDEIAVAKQFGKTAAELQPLFVGNVGDNFYYYGIKNTEDSQVAEDFTNVFTAPELQVPWISALGNHDYGYNVSAQIALTDTINRWVMPDTYFYKRVQLTAGQYASFVVLDTNVCVSAYIADDPSGWDPCGSSYPHPPDCKFHQNIINAPKNCSMQYTWLKNLLPTIPAADWKFVIGHHVANEVDVEDLIGLIEAAKVDMYLNGHAHTLTQYTVDGTMPAITTGAGCMIRIDGSPEAMHDEPPLQSNSHTISQVWNQKTAGFTTHLIDMEKNTLTTNFVSFSGETLHSFTITKGGSGPTSDDQPTNDDNSGGSCKEYGCGSYDKDHSCQCNYKCKYYDNCCSDYNQECGSASA